MSKIKYYLEKYKIYIIVAFIILLITSLLLFLYLKKEKVSASEVIIENEIKKEDLKEVKEEINKVKVDVKGRVKKEGVYELELGSRVIDAINKAGGLKENANTDYINLSKKLTDEMIIIIYSNDEVSKFKEEEKQIIYIEYKCECPDNINDSCITKDDVVNTNGVDEKEEKIKDNNENTETEKQDKLISINNGTLEELMTLPGVGESKAKNIIEYRENNKFEKIEDIMNVSGIGESAYSKIKDLIKL